MRTAVVYLLALVAIAAGVGLGFFDPFGRGSDEEQRSAGPRAVPVVVAEVVRAPIADSLEALGTARANESVRLTAVRSGQVSALHFDDGQEVEAGALLMELNVAEEEALLEEAQALLADRLSAWERVQDLYEREIAAESEIDTAKAQLDAARSRVRSLEAMIAEHRVVAPFAGRLGLRMVSLGAFVQASDPIATLDDLSLIKVDFTIPESWLRAVRVRQPIVSTTDAWPGEVFPGEVSAIDTQLDARTRSATVRAIVPNPERRILPGMLMRVTVDRGEAAVLQVPEDALVQKGDRHEVIVVGEDGIAQQVDVEIGRRRVGRVEVLSGVAEGDRVVVEGLVRVRPGNPVEVVSVRGDGS